jgi:hypothetical protein
MPTLTARPAAPIVRAFPDDYPPVHVRGISLRPVPQDVAVARRFARDYGRSRGISEPVVDDIVLGVSEIAGNLRHVKFPPGRCHAFMQLRQLGPFVSVRVFDPDPTLPTLRDPLLVGLGAECGRGLSTIVAALAVRLEFGPSPHGLKFVSFMVDALPSRLR